MDSDSSPFGSASSTCPIALTKAITQERNLAYHGTQLVHSAPYECSEQEKHPDIIVLQQPWTEKVLPDVKPLHGSDSRLGGFEMYAWQGLVAPAGTPDDVVETLSASLKQVLEAPALVDDFAKISPS